MDKHRKSPPSKITHRTGKCMMGKDNREKDKAKDSNANGTGQIG
jgi:hypothetical protein